MLLAAGAAAPLLSACSGFAPVYGDASSGGIAAARFNFAAPNSRIEQIIINRLKISFPNPAGPQDPTLSVNAGRAGGWTGISNAFPVGRPAGAGVRGTVTITQADVVLFSATRVTQSTYQGGKLTPTDIFSDEGAQEVTAVSTADALRAAILAGYRPGTLTLGVAPPLQ